MVKRITAAFLCAAFLCAAPGLSAETVTSAEIYMNSSALINEKGISSPPLSASGGVTLSVDSTKADAVKSSIRFTVDNTAALSLEKAYIKARFPWVVSDTSLRFTAGKAPLSWGKGFVFNAGDLVFGSVPPLAGLSNGEYRTAADWMALAYLPLGPFSFAELVYLPPVSRSAGGSVTTGGSEPAAAVSAPSPLNRAGGRMYLSADAGFLQSVEGGYLYEEATIQKGYLALDGSLFFDWYGSASIRTEQGNKNRYELSFGLFRVFNFIPDVPLSFRAEGLVYPEQNRLIWFPSLQAGLTDSLSASFQGLFATGKETGEVDAGGTGGAPMLESGNALTAIVCTWTPLKGITLSGTLYRYIEKGDLLKPDTIVQLGVKSSF